MVPDMQCKILKWLKNNVHLSTLQKNLRVKIPSRVSSKAECGAVDDSGTVSVPESDIADPVAVKSVPLRRRTKSNLGILNDPKMLCSPQEIFSNKKTLVNEVKVDQRVNEEPENSNEATMPHAVEKVIYIYKHLLISFLVVKKLLTMFSVSCEVNNNKRKNEIGKRKLKWNHLCICVHVCVCRPDGIFL